MGNATQSDKRPPSAVEALAQEKPTQLMAQLRAVWPQVLQALDAGHTLRLIHKRLNMVGVEISYKRLIVYRAAALSGEKKVPPLRAIQVRRHQRDRRTARRRPSIPWPIFARRNRSGRAGSIRQALPTKASSSEDEEINHAEFLD